MLTLSMSPSFCLHLYLIQIVHYNKNLHVTNKMLKLLIAKFQNQFISKCQNDTGTTKLVLPNAITFMIINH